MVKKKTKTKKASKKTRKRSVKKIIKPDFSKDRDIASDFAVKIYERFDKLIKAVVLFGSSAKGTAKTSSDIDIIVLIDDASVVWDQQLIAWYREELAKIASSKKYKKDIHITTTKLTTWWSDLMKGDPTILNIIRYGDVLVDVGGFFNPLKVLLEQGRIKSTPEAIYNALQRAPAHYQRSRIATLSSMDGLFWAMVDSAQAALMAANIMAPSPDQVGILLKETFVKKRLLKDRYADWYIGLLIIHKKISHGEMYEIKGGEIAEWQEKTEEFIEVMVKLVNDLIKVRKWN
jgi:predicted nucleotidyltransferase/uncharacterized protein (UPF0332 family)